MSQLNGNDDDFMGVALRLAVRGCGSTSPNPMVGAVIVKDNKIVGQGFHQCFGGPHAETFALEEAGQQANGATLYINLEPCTHYGHTPPCVDQVIQSGISRVVIGNRDPNPQVNGKGIQKLKEAGIEVRTSVREEEGLELNEAYFTYIALQRPFITLKWAQSLDGRIATRNYESFWISNERSRKVSHQLRKAVDAILVGAGTVNCDNPHLTVRHARGTQPWRLILDKDFDIRTDARILSDAYASKTVVFTLRKDHNKTEKIEKHGTKVIVLTANQNGEVGLSQITDWMASHQLISLLVEGGKNVLTSFLVASLADKVMVFIAPKLFGTGVDAIGDLNVNKMDDIISLKKSRSRKIGSDILIEAYLSENHVYRTD